MVDFEDHLQAEDDLEEDLELGEQQVNQTIDDAEPELTEF